MASKVLIERANDVLRLVLNRPEKKNALDREMYLALIEALKAAEADEGVRVVLFSGAGGVFTAGNDLSDFLLSGAEAAEDFPALRFVVTLAKFPKPVISAVAGDAVGVGSTMLLHCDLVYAAPNARFKFPFVDLGLVPEAASSLLAPQLFGGVKAAQYLLLCEFLGAEEALRLGFINEIVAEADLLSKAESVARKLAEKPFDALLATRRLLRADLQDILARIEEEAKLFREAMAQPAMQARIAAFFAKDRR
ncbi:MAG TPA: enoyl-CoA hydratase-related protein [Methylocystis sp.]|nr:enoyl-CoA hydratase-related protein [Methylocystis sp.]